MSLWTSGGLIIGIWLGFTIAGPIGSVVMGLLGMVIGWLIWLPRDMSRSKREAEAVNRAREAAEKRGEYWSEPDD